MAKGRRPVELARLNALFRGYSDANKSSRKIGFRISATKMWLLLEIDICIYKDRAPCVAANFGRILADALNN
jgi:hypothetical protein